MKGGEKRVILPQSYVLLVICALSILLNLASANASTTETDFYYYSGGGKIKLPLSKKMVTVRFRERVALQQEMAVAESEGNLGRFSERQEFLDYRITLLTLREGLTKESIIQIIEGLNAKSEIEFAGPVFQFPDGILILTDEFNVKFAPSISEKQIETFNALNNVEIARKEKYADWYVLRVKDPRNMNALKVANLYYESPITEFSVPNFVMRVKAAAVIPDDTYFAEQWSLDNTGQSPPGGTPDADIDAPEGWEISTGSSDIVIAIIDTGVDLAHEDLIGKLVSGYDADEGDYDPSPENSYPEDTHGTGCAGLAAAETNNGKGVSGVAWGCKIMPIRVAHSAGGAWLDTTEDKLASGIQWAAEHGADVLSNSWAISWDSDTIHNAIINAKNNGRDGKGCVIAFASGNYGSSVIYPAKYPEVIAVGATDHHDERWFYSNYGPELDVVAPSAWGNEAGVIFWTTDISGSAGYNNGDLSKGDADGNYTKWFGGTSAAAPQVAGLAALILSVNPELTSDEVQTIIESTADDKGDPGRDDYYGWGRINVYKALIEAAKNEQILSKVDNVNDGDSVSPGNFITYTITYANPATNPELTGVTITDYLPDEVDYSSSPGGIYDSATRTVTWNIPPLPPGSPSSFVTLIVTVNLLAEPLGTITNRCDLRSNEYHTVITTEITNVDSWNPDIIYVDMSAPGSYTGMSWEDAYSDLQDALERARAGCGNEIWVAAGTYKPITSTMIPNYYYATFELVEGVPIYGGFAGGETALEQRNYITNQTILTGDINNDGDSDVQNVVTALNDVGQETIIDGFTITKSDRAAVYCNGGSPTIANNTIQQSAWGIGCENNSSPVIIKACLIQDNASVEIPVSGGIGYVNSVLTITDCIIANNNPGYGIYGDINYGLNSQLTVTNSIIRFNGYQGIYLINMLSTTIKNNWIHNNGTYYGDGIYIYDCQAPATIRNNTIVYNNVYGISCYFSTAPDISNCIIWGNNNNNDQLDGCTTSYSCVQNGDTNNGNINTDPLFLDADTGDYHLTWDSGCVDSGNSSSIEPDEVDIDGNPRVMGTAVDIGGDEDFPHCLQNDYNQWISVGRPDCWCYPRQCHGDADGKAAGSAKVGYYYVGPGDLNILVPAYLVREPPIGPGIASIPNGICADFAHDLAGSAKVGYYRVGPSDLNILVANYLVREPPIGPGIPPDCLDCQRVLAEQQKEKVKPLEIKQIIKWLEELWLDEEVRKAIDEDTWLKFIESLKEDLQSSLAR